MKNKKCFSQKLSEIKTRYIAPWPFCKRAAANAIPLALQTMFTSCMGIIDSLMVSWIDMVSAVGTAAQLDTLSATVAYGAIGGTGVFAAQYFGAKDSKNLKRTFGLSIILAILNGLIFTIIGICFGRHVISFYIKDAAVVANGYSYLKIMAFSFIPASVSYAFSYIYRTINKTKVPLYVGIIAMTTNCIVNYTLIFGKFGFPKLGVMGAGVGTVAAQTLAMVIHIIYAIKTKQPFIGSFKEIFNLDSDFVSMVMERISPLICNELLFGFGSTLFIKAFGTLGKNSLDAFYVGNKINDVFVCVENGISNACAVIIGNTLGEGDIERAKKEGDYFVSIATFLAIVSTVLILTFASPLVAMFNLKDAVVIASATKIVRFFAIKISLRMFILIVFSTLRAGGDSKMLALLDSGLVYTVGLPLAFASVTIFGMTDISSVFLLIQIEQIIRIILGLKRYKSGAWAVNLAK